MILIGTASIQAKVWKEILRRMENVKKMARSHSVKMTELLRLQSKVEAEGEGEAGEAEAGAEDTELPTKLPILRVAGHEGTKQQRRERERENRQLANGGL